MRIYFFCYPQGPAERAGYQHQIISLGEGLASLGHEIYSDINYWEIPGQSRKFLFSHNPDVRPDDCDIVVLNSISFDYGGSLPPIAYSSKRPFLSVYIDASDGFFTHGFRKEFRNFDVILKSHFNTHIRDYPRNFKPWAFGLTNRQIEIAKSFKPWNERRHICISNTRIAQQVRSQARLSFFPKLNNVMPVLEKHDGFVPPSEGADYFEWERTGRRHNPEFYSSLGEAKCTSCFGGKYGMHYMYPGIRQYGGKLLYKIFGERFQPVYQWDSFRFWETLAAQCVAVHLDFVRYGLALPVMPIANTHYIGIDLMRPELAIGVFSDEEALEKIASAGRNWAITHYSPVAVAQRFIKTLESDKGKGALN
jgi:hypothetical protein